MVVQVKLYGLLRLRTRNYDADKGIKIDIEKGFIIKDLLNTIEIDFQKVAVVFLNDSIIKDFEVSLNDGDVIKVFPQFPSGG